MAVSATFAAMGTLSCQTKGNGMTSMMAPVTTLGIDMKRAKAISSMQEPLGRDLSQAKATGEQEKMATMVLARQVRRMTAPMV